ncbi:hypothetical protein L3Q82_019495 [Scortum barcoo]|uniref:Uncharacterized protein n=1 Tax=Scortum barcoo TaxID=214431 RepID=A0ACB8VB87_9TELE|nr:hypothetical protein L3Q82_019495 [Scortum barcoo]
MDPADTVGTREHGERSFQLIMDFVAMYLVLDPADQILGRGLAWRSSQGLGEAPGEGVVSNGGCKPAIPEAELPSASEAELPSASEAELPSAPEAELLWSSFSQTFPGLHTWACWTEDASSALQDCFECTDWEVFKEGIDLDGYTSSVLSYLKFCTDAVLPTKTIKVFPNQKPWLDSTVKPLLKACEAAYRSGDKLAYNIARKEAEKRH